MKRFLAWMLAAMCLIGTAAAAETPHEFSFRNGITWGMEAQEILEYEGEEEWHDQEQLAGGVKVMMLEDAEVSLFEADLSYVFAESSLQMCLYELSLDEEEAGYLTGALQTKYGEGVHSHEMLYEMMCALVPDIYEEEDPFAGGLCWYLLDGTVIQFVGIEGSDAHVIAYMNYDALHEMLDGLEKDGYNLFGL